VTLRFLGDTDPTAKEAVIQAASIAALPPPFEVRLKGWGAFPRPDRARVVWIGVSDPSDRLARLAGLLEQAARTANLPPEDRPFRPHLTLVRVREPVPVRRILDRLPEIDIPLPVDQFVLFRSMLGGGAPRYEPVRGFTLPG
jgi:RNA 2',3'-cyclic 3'-phosphodiesterase